jgi:diadenylate cyclase
MIEIIVNKLLYGLSVFWEVFRNIMDVLLVAFLLYKGWEYLARTRAVQLLKGFLAIVFLALISNILHLETLSWMITNITTYIVIAVIILFQPELRRLITQFGQRNWISGEITEDALQLDELVNAVGAMAEEKVGSLIVIERKTGLRSYAESGVSVNATISEELLRTVFFPNTALHDGAVIVQEGKVSAAACYLPLSDSKQLKKQHGARHRAALGIAEETDALVIVTSEETGNISVMVNGRLFSKIKLSELKNMILFFMNPKTEYEERYPPR